MNNCELLNELEQIIDKTSLSAVLCTISEICYGKEDHLVSNWQDQDTAKQWHKAGRIVDSCAVKIAQFNTIGISH
jgi:hypothetical protein